MFLFWWGRWLGMDGNEQKVGRRGCEGRSPFVSRRMGIKPKTSFRHCIPTRCSRWVALHPTHIPRRPKKKPLRGKKVGFAEKKSRLQQCEGTSDESLTLACVCSLKLLPQPTLSRLTALVAAYCLQAVLGFALLACPQFAIYGGGLFVIIAGFGCRVVGVGRWGR